MFENTFQGPGAGTYADHTIEILLMLFVALLLGLLLGYIIWYRWRKLYADLQEDYDRLRAVHTDLEKEHASLRYKHDELDKSNHDLKAKARSLEADVAIWKGKFQKVESELAIAMDSSISGREMSMPPEALESVRVEAVMGTVAPVPPVPDDLKKVEGVGPKIEMLLNDSGIWTFRQFADTSTERLQEILDSAGPNYKIADPGTWAKQAGLAADGNWDELQEYQDFLSGGKPPSS